MTSRKHSPTKKSRSTKCLMPMHRSQYQQRTGMEHTPANIIKHATSQPALPPENIRPENTKPTEKTFQKAIGRINTGRLINTAQADNRYAGKSTVIDPVISVLVPNWGIRKEYWFRASQLSKIPVRSPMKTKHARTTAGPLHTPADRWESWKLDKGSSSCKINGQANRSTHETMRV